jgi:hypothetical protein
MEPGCIVGMLRPAGELYARGGEIMDKNLLLVGSVPLETPQEVFEVCGRTIGAHVPCLPDGETDERIYWIIMLAYRVFHGHPDIRTVKRPPRDRGVEKWKPKDRTELWSFKVKAGVKEVKFADPGWRLGYARAAINSYFIFRTLRQEGVIPSSVRFQVSLPMTNSAVDAFFHDPRDHDRVKPGFEAAMLAEIDKIIEKIPPDDLAIQWDCCIEIMDFENAFPWLPKTGKLERNLAPIARLSPHIPPQVMLGYHLCYGTLGGWPMVQPKDLSAAVQFANELVVRASRRVDFVHIPILSGAGEEYFAPLQGLSVGGARVYLGGFHGLDDMADFRNRLLALKKYVPEFGLAAPCGFGRLKPEEVPGLLQDHLKAIEVLRELSAS